MPNLPPVPVFIAIALIIFLAIGIHEFAHAKFADLAGDPTPRAFGRVTLNLFKHFDILGTIMIFISSFYGIGIGWGRPVPMDPSKMRNPRWDHFFAVLAGPVSNLLQAILFAILLRLTVNLAPELMQNLFLSKFLVLGVVINLSLFFFNLLPIGPLDGMWILGTFMRERTRWAWTHWNLSVGQFLFLGLILFGQVQKTSVLGSIIRPPIEFMLRFLTGVPFNL